MKKIRLIIFFITILLYNGCKSDKSNNYEDNTLSSKIIELYLFPPHSDGFTAYSIIIDSDTMITTTDELGRIKTRKLPTDTFQIVTSLAENAYINNLFNFQQDSTSCDEWSAQLIFNDSIIYYSNNYNINDTTNNDAKLINLLYSISPIEIELYPDSEMFMDNTIPALYNKLSTYLCDSPKISGTTSNDKFTPNIDLLYFPSDAFQYPRYLIVIRSDTIYAVNEHGEVKMNILPDDKYNRIKVLAFKLYTEDVYYKNLDEVTDSWGSKLIINNIIIQFELCDRNTNNLDLIELKELIIESSPIEIDLYGFGKLKIEVRQFSYKSSPHSPREGMP